jgi:hypothetical protein
MAGLGSCAKLFVPLSCGIALVVAGPALGATPKAGNWGIGATLAQAKNVASPNTGHLFVISPYRQFAAVIEDAILIHPCGKPDAGYHQLDLFNYRTGEISKADGGSFSYSGSGWLQDAGQPGRPTNGKVKTVTASFSGTFTSATRAHGTYQVHAAGCKKHSFIAAWFN